MHSMPNKAERLRWAREQRFETVAEAAEALGVNRFTYAQHENGTRGFKNDNAEIYARRFGVRLEWLLTGKGAPSGASRPITVRGYVGAGDQVATDGEGSMDFLETVDLPVSVGPEAEAVIVRGSSMWPYLEDGEVIIYDQCLADPTPLVRRKVVAKLTDGRVFVKVLRRGSQPGLWTLDSFAGPPLEDVALQWAAAIKATVLR